MIDVNTALQNILKAVYGKDVRQSIHDAISQINDNSLEAIDLSQIKYGTDVVSPTSPVGTYIEGTLYLNIDTGIMWKLDGGVWSEVTHLKAIDDIIFDSSTGLADTYIIKYNDGTTSAFTVTNGASIANIAKVGSAGLVDIYEITLDNGQKLPARIEVTNGKDAISPTASVTKANDVTTITITDVNGTKTVDVLDGKSIIDVVLESTIGSAKTYKIQSSDGSFLPTKFTINDGVNSYVHIRYSGSFDGNPMTSTPSASTPYIGICTTTQNSAPTDPSVYSWVKFIGESGTGTGDMLKADYSTKYANVVDKAAALYDGANEYEVSQLMTKSAYDADGDGIVDKAAQVGSADTSILEEFSDNGNGLKYKGKDIGGKVDIDNKTIVENASGELEVADSIVSEAEKIQNSDDWLKSKNLCQELLQQGVIFVTGGADTRATSVRTTNLIKVKPNTNYKVSCKNKTAEYFIVYFETSNYEVPAISSSGSWLSDSYQILTPSNCNYIGINVRKNSTDPIVPSEVEELQLEEGTVITAYQPYNKSNVELSEIVDNSADWLGSNNLFNINDRFEGTHLLQPAGHAITFYVDAKGNSDYTVSLGSAVPSGYNLYVVEKPARDNSAGIATQIVTSPQIIKTDGATKVLCVQFASNDYSVVSLSMVENLKIQIEEGTKATAYKPYNMSNVELTGKLDIKKLTNWDEFFEDYSGIVTSYSVVNCSDTFVMVCLYAQNLNKSTWHKVGKLKAKYIPSTDFEFIFTGSSWIYDGITAWKFKTNGDVEVFIPAYNSSNNACLTQTYIVGK